MVSSIIVHHCLWTLWSIYSVPSVCGASWQGSYLHQGWTRNCTRALNGGAEFGSFQSLWRCKRRYLRRTHITKSIHPVVLIDEAVEDQNWLFKPSVTRLVCSSLFVRMYIVNFFVLCYADLKFDPDSPRDIGLKSVSALNNVKGKHPDNGHWVDAVNG